MTRGLLVLAASCLALPAIAQQSLPVPTRAPASAAEMRLSFAPIVKRVAPAVVNVYSKRVVRAQLDPFWSFFAGGMPRSRIEQSLGSGSIVRSDGVILTNHHNIEGAQEIRVVTSDRREWAATVLLDDPRADLAVLKIDTKGERLPTIPIDAEASPQVGDLVLAIGDPFGVGQTVTNGIVSALARSDVGINDYAFFIQTDAAINPGNSGGPLVDMNGDLIGVNTAIVSSSGASAGVGFAIPAVMAKQVVETAMTGGHSVVRPWLGARTQTLTDEMAHSFGLSAPVGVVVTQVWPGGPAERAGLRSGDVIEAVNGAPIDSEGTLTYRIATLRPGESAQLTVRRGATSLLPRLTVEPPPTVPAEDKRTIAGQNPLAGATVVNLSPASAIANGVDPFAAHGVLVTAVASGPAGMIGLRSGDVVLQVNGQAVSTTAGLVALLSNPARGWTLSIQRGDQVITARFEG
ncbi:MAG TPA: Do family serine endopeptidase [Caulobacteraceae bacterium]|nr:Do family serine endopeptidase [Caulobacteraceae bacterium]